MQSGDASAAGQGVNLTIQFQQVRQAVGFELRFGESMEMFANGSQRFRSDLDESPQ